MAELTLRDPLSGAEIKEILLQEIANRLDGDSTLLDDLTYAGFKAKFDIRIGFVRSLTPESLIWGNSERNPEPETATEDAGSASIHDDYTSSAPNVERTEHNLPIPVMIQTPTGMERRKVQIERTGRKPGRPSNAELAARKAAE